MTTSDAVRLIAAREIRVKLRDKTFLFSTLFFLIFAVGGTVLPAMLGDDPPSVAVADRAVAARLAAADLEVRQVADDRAAEQLVRDGDVEAAVVAGPTVLANQEAPGEVVRALSTEPTVRLLDPDAFDPVLRYLVPLFFAMIFFFTTLTFGLQIAQSVTEEKQTRIVEILVAAVPVRALLAGKVVAGGLLAFGQILLIAVVAVIGSQFSDTGKDLLPLLAPAIGWFVPYFVVGFVMLAALWAAVGALVNRQEDINGASTPVTMLTMLPFFAVVVLNQNAVAMQVMSYVPFSAPIAMPLRLFAGDVALWEPVLALVLLVLTAGALIVAGARIYEGSLLRTNGRTSITAAWRDRETSRLAKLDAR